ncbi:hypothetical protein KFK09_026521 [Dendrobium nobile]|uniref:Aminotransferase-like plant mobile domain-containing protein n=1 Tax=Dendrobium nobile TaxID=94219 RepID=A0A8T3A8Z2_DENNO|nr:hypothetical protein KFK09_026521 [Dendrobium nobile]
MSGQGASFVLMYGGQLLLDEKYSQTYVGGSNRPFEQHRSFCHDILETSERPSVNVDDDYETMSSGSSEAGPNDYDDNAQYNLDEINVDMNLEIHSILQRYCYTNVGTTKGITVNNDFVKAYSSTREWDEDVTNDRAYVGSQVEEEFSIPIELMEGMCFIKKGDIQFALQGWSIINNVEYVIVASNRQKFTVICAQSGRHTGLVRCCRENFPHAAHHHCLRHLRENFKKLVRQMGAGDVEFLYQKMYMAGNTNDPMIFDRCRKDMINVKGDIHQWLVERDVTSWALTYDGGFRFGVMTINASESFNGVLKRARGLPIQALITAIYYNVVALHLRRNEMLEGSEIDATRPFAPRVQATLRKIEQEARSHRAAHTEQGTILEATSHLLMVHEWPINCPRFMEALVFVGLDSVSQMRYRRMDHHLLTALVERWSPQTNTFNLPVGEMSITLQDVSMILGIQIDGPSFIGHSVVGSGRRWLSWPDCCDDLLGQHPDPDVLYHDPFNPRITAKCKIGQAHVQTCVPLRWLRWIFWRGSYIDLSEMDFWRYVRAYILFLLGCHLLPDSSGSEIHLQYLPLMEDIAIFRTYLLGGAVLAHLYRELSQATRPKRANIAGCIHLLQIWAWEHLHVGRPQLHVSFLVQLDGLSVGIRWNEERLREVSVGNFMTYRDELDGLLESQVPEICTSDQDTWLSRVSLISWKRVEWHLPDRVLRQFGYCPSTDIMPMDPSFVRVDGRGKLDTDWALYHQASIALWESRRAYIITGEIPGFDYDYKVKQYLAWFYSWATLYMLKPLVDPPSTHYPRSPAECHMRDCFVSMERRLQPHFGGTEGTPLQVDVNIVGDMCQRLRQQIYIDDAHYFDEADTQVFSPAIPTADPYDAGPSSYPDLGPSQSHFTAEFDVASTPQFVPSSLGEPPVTQ